MKFRIDGNGDVLAVYSDKLPELKLGPMQMTRASNVEFDASTQLWEARTPSGELIASGPNRTEVISQEVNIIEARI